MGNNVSSTLTPQENPYVKLPNEDLEAENRRLRETIVNFNYYLLTKHYKCIDFDKLNDGTYVGKLSDEICYASEFGAYVMKFNSNNGIDYIKIIHPEFNYSNNKHFELKIKGDFLSLNDILKMRPYLENVIEHVKLSKTKNGSL